MIQADFSKKLIRTFAQTCSEYSLIKDGSKVLVALSGGKDSLTLAHLIRRYKRVAPFDFEYLAVTVAYDESEDWSQLEAHCKEFAIPHRVERTNIFQTASDHIRENSSFCSYFSRMRRGALYRVAVDQGFDTLALGHHLDDAAESFFMNLHYNGKLRTMPPFYYANDYPIKVIRPLIKARERQLAHFAESNSFAVVGDEACPALKIPTKQPYARYETKEWLKEMERSREGFFDQIRRAFENVDSKSFFDNKILQITS